MKRCICICCLAFGLAAAARPVLSVAFPFQLYRSGESSPCLYNLAGPGLPGMVDLYAVVTYTDAAGTRATRYAGPTGQLGEGAVPYRPRVRLAAGQSPLGCLSQPSFACGTTHPVTWWLYTLPAGTQVAELGELARGSLSQMAPTQTTVAAEAFSRPWENFAFLQSTSLVGGIRLRAEVSEEGRRFRCVVDEGSLEDFWRLPGPKLVLIAGLGCGARAWIGDEAKFVLEGKVDYRRQGILCYPELLKHYRHVAIFDYPSAGALDGPEIGGRIREAFRYARPEDRIDLIGHSMGGMVVRQFVEAEGGHQVIDRAVFMQTPLNGLSNTMHDELAGLLPTTLLNGTLAAVSPLSKMLRGSPYYERLNAPWLRHDPLASANGFGTCRYYCVAAGVYGSGRDPRRTEGWFDNQSDAFPTEIKATSALWFPLGGGGFGELDPTGEHELLLTSPSTERNRYLQHVSYIFYLADDERNGTARWLRTRLWPEAGDRRRP